MPNPQISHPNGAVPFVALSYGDSGANAVAVTATTGLPMREQPYRAARALVANTVVTPAGSALMVDCTVAGAIAIELADAGGQVIVNLPVGLAILPLAAQRFLTTGTTALFNAWVLD